MPSFKAFFIMVYIDVKAIIHELFYIIGVKDNIKEAPLLDLLQHGHVEACVEQMANYMGLPIRVNIKYGGSFNTNSLVTIDKRDQGVSGITAQVIIPSDLPMYDKKLLTNFPITIQITGNFKKHPDTFIAIMAHELSHIVLASLRYPKSNNEFYTDITAMMLGFNVFIKNGRETRDTHFEDNIFTTNIITTINKYGYLDNDQFQRAYFLISDLLNENNNIKLNLIHRYELLNAMLEDLSKLIVRFKRTLNYLDKHLNLKIKANDIQKILEFHQPNYLQEKEILIQDITEKLHAKATLKSITHYFNNWEVEWNKEFDILEHDITEQMSLLKQDLDIINRNFGIRDKINLIFNLNI